MNDSYNKYIFEKTNYTINDYPKNKIILADILRLTDGKTHVTVIDRETEEILYNDRAEYITWTSEGCCSSLCSKEVAYIDSMHDEKDGNSIEVHVIMKEEKLVENEFFDFLMKESQKGILVFSFLDKIATAYYEKFQIKILSCADHKFNELYNCIMEPTDENDNMPMILSFKDLCKYLDKKITRIWVKQETKLIDHKPDDMLVISLLIDTN